MWVWIVVAVVVLAIAAWAYSPRQRRMDSVVRQQQESDKRDVAKFRPPNTPGGAGMNF